MSEEERGMMERYDAAAIEARWQRCGPLSGLDTPPFAGR